MWALVQPRLLGAVERPLLVVCAGVARVWTAFGSTGRRGARRLAAAAPARRAARDAEARLRAIVATYAVSTPLEPRLLVIEDRYAPGVAGSGLFTLHRADCRVSCRILVTAYFSSPLPPAETLSRILDAGERACPASPSRANSEALPVRTTPVNSPGPDTPWPGTGPPPLFPNPLSPRTTIACVFCVSPRPREVCRASAAGTARCSR